MRSRPEIPAEIEEYRDERWRREGARQVSNALEAERFIDQVGFAACLTDSRRPGASLYVAVCGRRDAVMPRNVQKDEEASATWLLKDELIRRGNVYYAKLARGKTMFIAPRMIPYFNAIWGMRRSEEKSRLSRDAQKILKVLRKEWEMATSDLKVDSGMKDRASFTRALDELQAAMLVVPEGVYYEPKFTYIWTLGISRFPDALSKRVKRDAAVKEIARCFLTSACLTIPGELARVTGLSRPEAGRGNRALVKEGFAIMLAPGWYQLKPSILASPDSPDSPASLASPASRRKVAKPDVFAMVKKIGLAMPDVEASIRYDGSEVLKAGGSFMAAIATDESAEADTLVVRCELDDRELLLEDAPETYYVTDFYAKYPLVLVRLAEVTEDALRDLLSVSRRMALEKNRR